MSVSNPLGLPPRGLDLDIKNLTAPIHAVCRIHAVRAVEGAVLGVFGQLRQRELHGTAAFAAALLGLFTFWLSHEKSAD